MSRHLLAIAFLLLALAFPLYAVRCFETESPNGYVDCSGKYCSREILGTKVTNMCGNAQGDGGYTCTTTGTQQHNTPVGPVTKYCCKGDYCNSSTSTSTFFALAAPLMALLVGKL